MGKIWTAITRQKSSNEEENKLARVLTLVDLIGMGMGSTLGLGVYVLAGSVAKNYAGPATVISFLIAAAISLFGGFCYAEFAARVPRAGYSYAYCYAGVGELVAFIVGWNLLLGSMLSSASVASGMSSYVDALMDNKIRSTLNEYMPMNSQYLSPSPDFLSLGIILLLTVLLAIGVKESSLFNNICTVVNLMTIVTVIAACATKANINNWRIPINSVPPEHRKKAGEGGFVPFGVSGIITGTPNCFFGYAGFDAAANCSEEAKNPKRNIPLAILISLLIVFIIYSLLSMVLTLAWPYYLQDEEAPFPHVFAQFGWIWLKWVVSVGAICALSASVFGAMYMLPRIFYAMASDGLIFKIFANVHPVTKTPIISTILSGLASGLMAALLNLNELLDLMTIGGFFGYIIVAAAVLVLRYDYKNEESRPEQTPLRKNTYLEDIFSVRRNKIPTRTSAIIANVSILFYTIVATVFCIIITNKKLFTSNLAFYISCTISLTIIIAIVLVMLKQPETQRRISFKVPLVPFIPCLSILFNIYLMMQLNPFIWISFLGWIGLGCVMYFFYGIKHSKENTVTAKM